MAEDKSPRGEKPARKPPKKATARYLENVALWYLQRFAASTESLRRVLMRRVDKSVQAHETDRAEGAAFVEDILQRYRRAGLLDDRAYAAARTASLNRRGVSSRGVQARLAAKGVAAGDVAAALDTLRETVADPDLAAAVAYVRRRRLGPYRTAAERADYRDRDLAALGRQGFGYDIARRAVDAADPDALDSLIPD